MKTIFFDEPTVAQLNAEFAVVMDHVQYEIRKALRAHKLPLETPVSFDLRQLDKGIQVPDPEAKQ